MMFAASPLVAILVVLLVCCMVLIFLDRGG